MDSVSRQLLLGGYKITPPSQIVTTTTTSITIPAGVTSISAVTVGRGGTGSSGFYNDTNDYVGGNGAGGGALAYVNNVSVTPGEVLLLEVSSTSSKLSRTNGTILVEAGASTGVMGGVVKVGTGWPGGNGSGGGLYSDGGGGGAGGYSGKGGDFYNNGQGGGGGGGGFGSPGGGVGLLGQGNSGATPGQPGSNGSGKIYGGGGSGGYDKQGGVGAIRVIWPGNLRQFPSTRTGNE